MLEIKGITKAFDNQEILRNLNYTFLENKVYFIVGESGSGKTTLLKILGGYDKEYEGIVLYNNNDIRELTQKELINYYTGVVSYISQFPVCFQELKGKENIKLPNGVNRKTTNNFGSFLNNIKLKKKAKQMSVGEKQRICIQRVLNQNTKIILADEPTASLDKQHKNEVIEELIKRAKEKILIVVTHDIELANLYADEIIEIKKGKIKSNKNHEKIETKKIEEVNKNLSFVNAFKFAKNLYKSEKKKSLLYNYSLIIGIVLMAFTNMLSDGMMSYFKDQLLIEGSQNYIEYFYDYEELSQEEYLDIISEVGANCFDYEFKTDNINTSITIGSKSASVSAFGLVNYELQDDLEDNEIEILLNEETNIYLTNQLYTFLLGMDFVEYINEFQPEININYSREELSRTLTFKSSKASIVLDKEISFLCNNNTLKNDLKNFFSLEYEVKYNGLIDNNLKDFIENQNEYFIQESNIYKHSQEELINKELISYEVQIEYGNVDFSFNQLVLKETQTKFEYFNDIPTLGRPIENKQEIVISSSLQEILFKNNYDYREILLSYGEQIVKFSVVGVVKNEENIIFYNQQNYEYLLDLFNSFLNYKDFPLKERIYLKKDIDYNDLLSFSNKQEGKIESSLIEVLQGMVPTLEGIKLIMKIFSIFTLAVSILTLFVLTILDFESKQKEYTMLKQTGYKKSDIYKINMFKTIFSNVFVIFFSIMMIEFLKVFMNELLGNTLRIRSMFNGYEYISNVLEYSLLSIFISNFIFILYTKTLTKI